jgi:flagellar motor switch protein FliN/FliY
MAETPDNQQAKTPDSEPQTGHTSVDASQMAEEALQQAQASAEELDAAAAELEASDAQAIPPVGGGALSPDLDMLGDVDLEVTIELGRTRMYVEDVLRLRDGSVVELDKLAGDPVDVYVNNCLIARGEVLVLNDNFCIRISEIVENLEEQAEDAALQQVQAG